MYLYPVHLLQYRRPRPRKWKRTPGTWVEDEQSCVSAIFSLGLIWCADSTKCRIAVVE